jgi:hypothetical protein
MICCPESIFFPFCSSTEEAIGYDSDWAVQLSNRGGHNLPLNNQHPFLLCASFEIRIFYTCQNFKLRVALGYIFPKDSGDTAFCKFG